MLKLLKISTLVVCSGLICLWAVPAPAATGEYRMLWVDVFHVGLRTPQEIDTMIAAARRGNYNAIIVQMRKACDAFYTSGVEPKNRSLDPSFDPLAYILQRARERGQPPLEVHAWLVAYRCRMPSDNTYQDPRHVYQRHPQWLSQMASGAKVDTGESPGRYYLDPGVPEVIDYNLSVVRDLLSRYDIDGIHFDYIRYPESPGSGNRWGYNAIALKRFNELYGRTGKPEQNDPEFNQFRRDQVVHMVRKVYAHVRAWRPQVKVSSALIAWGTVSKGFERTDAYAKVYQDWPRMAQEGWLDILIPMNYKRESVASQAADHRLWAQFLGQVALQSNRFAVNGVDGETLNTLSGITAQVRATRQLPGMAGIASYCYAETRKERKSIPDLEFFNTMNSQFFSRPASPPVASWLASPRTGLVKGVVSRRGKPIDGATITLGRQRTTTDGTGFYAFANVSPGAHQMTVQVGGADVADREVTVQAGNVTETPVDLR